MILVYIIVVIPHKKRFSIKNIKIALKPYVENVLSYICNLLYLLDYNQCNVEEFISIFPVT